MSGVYCIVLSTHFASFIIEHGVFDIYLSAIADVGVWRKSIAPGSLTAIGHACQLDQVPDLTMFTHEAFVNDILLSVFHNHPTWPP